ncbi:hypothetical protein BpHYR1_019244 [Brachionus plicatilis]|uniref:NTF2-related export protein n=1 Tax=Brachionus plicatilis TaxID=10195 RepID=A0A3M7PEB7_BRAPC|nr:hypothetical protein BpHYR1_019244 [Brachionus plicatilis]
MTDKLTVDQGREIGNAFVQAYYNIFDNGPRENLSNFYVPDSETSQMSFEGNLVKGQQAIVEKLRNLSFQKVTRMITAVDTQTTVENGIMIYVIGRLQTDSDPAHSFTQSFYLRNSNNTWFILNESFRLLVHNI